jgi:hypothetical protein
VPPVLNHAEDLAQARAVAQGAPAER